MSKKKVIIPIANGFEEIEAISIIDVLRRGGIDAITVGIDSDTIEGANKISIKTDRILDSVTDKEIAEFDMIVLPGGWGGTHVLAKNNRIQDILKTMDSQNKEIGAICAAPFALDTAGVLKDGFTCYPSVEGDISKSGYSDDKQVVSTGNVITSRGPGTAICFGLQIVRKLVDEETYSALKEGMLASYCE
jgi:4-methyl-5(b-hydroxyethyl)-thiazole monophosphate biosynthesis